MNPGTIRIGRRTLGRAPDVYVIAEAGVNHDGSETRARRLIAAARETGADAVKFQVFDPDRLVSATAPTAAYQRRTTGQSHQRDMLRALALPPVVFQRLAREARRRGLDFLATPFDLESLDVVAALGVPALKIGSGDLTHTALLQRAAATRLPVLLSTGMATLPEIAGARRTLARAHARGVCLLHCVSLYPTPPAQANVRGVATLRAKFGDPVGYSDHTLSIAASIGAVALGACVLEKHLTLDRRAAGPDHAASLEPEAFAQLVALARDMALARGDGRRIPCAAERGVARVARRSLAAARDLPAGTRLRPSDLMALRPATGIPANALPRVLGRVLRRAVAAGKLLHPSMLEP